MELGEDPAAGAAGPQHVELRPRRQRRLQFRAQLGPSRRLQRAVHEAVEGAAHQPRADERDLDADRDAGDRVELRQAGERRQRQPGDDAERGPDVRE